ncbi:MAG: hypothetical protein JSS96_13195 [Bacteroidetes bacterium]|nr:hypothetical protein [Bacteroidota bacterium]
MNQNLYHIALVTHIIGITVAAGAALSSYIITRQFWKQYAYDKRKAQSVQETIAAFRLLPRIGLLLLILSGVSMMALTKGVFGEQIWFRIKFGLVLIIIVHGIVMGRRQVTKLKKILAREAIGEQVDVQLLKIKGSLNRFHIIQISLFITVFVLSVFKFN